MGGGGGGGGGGDDEAGVIEEGAEADGLEIRERLQMPSKAEKRRKFFLKEEQLQAFTFEKNRVYRADFFNPYLDFSSRSSSADCYSRLVGKGTADEDIGFALKIPGISISVAKYIDEKTHCVRYVLKNRRSGDVFFVVIFKLLFGQELQETLGRSQNHSENKEGFGHNGATKQAEPTPPRDPRDPRDPYSVEPSNRDVNDPHNCEASVHRDDASNSGENATEPRQHSPQDDSHGAAGTFASNIGQMLPKSIASALSALGFGEGSSEEQAETDSEPENRAVMDDEISDRDIEQVSDSTVEEFLKSR